MSYFKSFICNGPSVISIPYSFFSPRRMFALQTEISGKNIQLFVFYFTSVSISSPCRKDQFAVFTYYFKIFTAPGQRKIQYPSLVCRCGFAVVIVFIRYIG